MTSQNNRAFRATGPLDLTIVDAHIDQLLHDTFAGPLSIARIASLMTPDPLDYARLGNLPPVEEGRLLEKAILLLASSNPDRTLLVDCRLPLAVTGAKGAVRHYRPDLVTVDSATGTAVILDIKRSLKSYESDRIHQLKTRMLQAAASLPERLARAGLDSNIREIRVAVVSIGEGRTDVERGVWSLEHLDHLLGVPGAAARVTTLRETFERRTRAQFGAALRMLIDTELRHRVAMHKVDAQEPVSASDIVIRLASLSRDGDSAA